MGEDAAYHTNNELNVTPTSFCPNYICVEQSQIYHKSSALCYLVIPPRVLPCIACFAVYTVLPSRFVVTHIFISSAQHTRHLSVSKKNAT